MGLTRYHKAKEVLKDYMEATGKKYIYTIRLQNLVRHQIAGTPSIVLSTLKMMREEGMITEVGIHKWEIKITK